MSDLKNTPYQEKIVKDKIQPLGNFLQSIQLKRGGTKKAFQPYYKLNESKKYSFDKTLKSLQEEKEDSSENENSIETPEKDNNVINGLYLAPHQRYFMGASNDPSLAIVTRVTDDKVHYYLYPYKKEQVLKKEIAAELFKVGSQTWLNEPGSKKDTDLENSIESVLNGEPGESVSIDDYQFSNIQVKYTGPEEGDLKPWKELESKYNVQIDNVLTNKQTYNLRLNNRELEQFQKDIREKTPRNFKIIKIIREEREYMIEAAHNPKLKTTRRPIAPSEEGSWNELLNQNRSSKFSAEDYMAGEMVVWDDEVWSIVDFVPSGEEDLTAILVTKDMNEVAEFVPLKDLKKYTPQDMGVESETDEQKNKDKPKPEELVSQQDEVKQNTKTKKKASSKKNNPTLWNKKKGAGLPVDEQPKERKIEFPKSENDGTTQDQKALKEDVNPVGKVRQLVECIQNNPTLSSKGGRFQVIVENLMKKRKKGIYDSELAEKAFEVLVDLGARKCANNPDRAEAIYPPTVRQKAAEVFKDQFEKNVEMGNYDPHFVSEDLIDIHIKKLIEETTEQVNEAVEKEAIPFTEKEIDEFQKIEGVNVDVENKVTYNWNSGGKNYTLEITKKPRPSTNDFVYSATTTFNNNQLDRERTVDSDPFRTEEDLNTLNEFLTSLNINESINEGSKDKKPDMTGEADKKKISAKDVHPEELMMGIKIELEHTKDKNIAKQIALDHLAELPNYYSKLKKMEKGAKSELKSKKKMNEAPLTKTLNKGGYCIKCDYVGRGKYHPKRGQICPKCGGKLHEETEEEKDNKPKKKTKKKDPKHTETKWVNALPTRNGKKVRSEVIGDVRLVYKTFEEKRKKEREKETKKKRRE